MTRRNHRPQSRRRTRAGFTLIEIMITVALVGILATVAGVNYTRVIQRARIARVISELHSISLVLDSFESDGGTLPIDLLGIADTMRDPWGHSYRYLKISGNLPTGLAESARSGLPQVSAPPASEPGAQGSDAGGGGGGAPAIADARKDRFLAPINSDYDLYSVGPDGLTRPPLQNKDSRDDIIRAANGSYFGPAESF